MQASVTVGADVSLKASRPLHESTVYWNLDFLQSTTCELSYTFLSRFTLPRRTVGMCLCLPQSLGLRAGMPKRLVWREQANVTVGAVGADVSLKELHQRVSDRTLLDDPPWLAAAFNPGHERFVPQRQIASHCITCQPKCSMRVRATAVADNNYVLHYAGQHSADPCSKKIRGWSIHEIKATRALGQNSSEAQMHVALHDAGCATEAGRKRIAGKFKRLRAHARQRERTQSCAQIRRWADERLHLVGGPHEAVIFGHCIDAAGEGKRFRLAFGCAGHQKVLENLPRSAPICLAADGTFKVVWGRYTCYIGGLLHLVTSPGKVRAGPGGRGQIFLPRVSFAPLFYSLQESEGSSACMQSADFYLEYLAQAKPALAAKLRTCCMVVTDFAEAPRRGQVAGFTDMLSCIAYLGLPRLRNRQPRCDFPKTAYRGPPSYR